MRETISPRQAGFLVLNAVLGVGVLSIAQETTRAAGTGSWLSVLLAGALATAAAWVVARLSHLFPGQSVIGYASLLWGAWAGRILGIVYGLYFLVLVGLVLRTFADLSVVFLLPRTPVPVTVVAMLGVTAYAGHLRINTFAFVSDLLVWLTLFPVVLLILAGLTRFRSDLLLPALSGGWSGVLEGMRAGIFSYLGFEVIAVLGGFVRKPRALGRWCTLGVAVPAVLYTGSVLVSVGIFGAAFVGSLNWPLMSVAGTAVLPGDVLERPEVLVAALWVLVAFTTAAVFFTTAEEALLQAAGRGNRSRLSVALVLPVYLISLVPEDPQATRHFLEIASVAGLVLAVGVPVLLTTSAWIRGWRPTSLPPENP